METGTYLSLGLYFVVMIAIGVYSYFKTKNDTSGFMLGGRGLGPAVTALSAGASDMSGWMLMGLPGALYLSGLGNIWIAIGLIFGAYLNYLLVASRLRVYTEVANDAVTLPEYFEQRFEDNSHLIKVLSSSVIIIFFAIYTTSGVVAGGKLFESSFGLSYEWGLYITAGVVVAYSAFGGFLAVSTTDFVQGCIMIVALVMVPLVALNQVGGVSEMQQQINSIKPELLSINSLSLLAIISAASWGLGYFGQPHIIVRFMAIRSVKDLGTARKIGMSWMIVSLIGAVMVGLSGFAFVSSNSLSIADPETIFIFLSTTLFSPFVGGFLLAAILAAIMSTISSQLLVTSSSLTEDLYHTFLRRSASPQELVLVGRICVVLVALFAVFLAHNRDSSILSLVSNAWAGFGAAFGPVVLLSLFWKRMNLKGALAGMVTGATTVLIWIYGPITINGQQPSAFIYEIVPGFILATLSIIGVSLLTQQPSNSIQTVFEKMQSELHHRMS